MDTASIIGIIGIGVALIGVGVMFFPPSHLSNTIRLWIAYPLIIVGIVVISFPFFLNNKTKEPIKPKPQIENYLTSTELISNFVEQERKLKDGICSSESEKVVKQKINSLDKTIKSKWKDKEFIEDLSNMKIGRSFYKTLGCNKPEMTYVIADIYFRIVMLERMIAKIQRKRLGDVDYKQNIIEDLNSKIYDSDLLISHYDYNQHINWLENVQEILEVNKNWSCFGSDYVERFSHVQMFATTDAVQNQQAVLKDIVREVRSCR